MGISLYWGDDARTILLMEIDGPWTWDELQAKMAKVKQLTAEAPHDISGIVDVSKGMFIPGGTVFNREGLDNAWKLVRLLQGTSAGAMVIVGANGAVRSIFDAFTKLDKNAISTVHFAKTVDEAYAILERQELSA
jgi:hypothetical protein